MSEGTLRRKLVNYKLNNFYLYESMSHDSVLRTLFKLSILPCCAIRHKPRKNMGGGACSVSVRVDATRKLVVE